MENLDFDYYNALSIALVFLCFILLLIITGNRKLSKSRRDRKERLGDMNESIWNQEQRQKERDM